nr:MAG TPA: Inhibitor of Apoptosis domain [Caudoviricetes sp.]
MKCFYCNTALSIYIINYFVEKSKFLFLLFIL